MNRKTQIFQVCLICYCSGEKRKLQLFLLVNSGEIVWGYTEQTKFRQTVQINGNTML